MIKLILCGLWAVCYLVLSIPLLIVLKLMNKKHPQKAARIAFGAVRWIFGMIVMTAGIRLTVNGKEKIPDGPCLYIANHQSLFDILVTQTQLPSCTGYVSKQSNFKVPLLGFWMYRIHCVALNRESARDGLKAILNCIDEINAGYNIFIFPEGTRNKTPEEGLLPFKEGSFKIATKTGCPIVPIAIDGTGRIFRDGFPGIRLHPEVTVTFCDPVLPSSYSKEEQKHLGATVQEIIAQTLQDRS